MKQSYAESLALTVVVVLASCRSARSDADKRLPFHVALLPITVESHPLDPSLGADVAKLAIDPEQVRASLEEVLGRQCFVRVSSTDDVPADGSRAVQVQLQKALDSGADLVLACSVDHDPVLRIQRNEKFWLNLPLFFLGGPACYFIDDHSYLGSARLRASLQDIHPLLTGRASLEDGRSEYAYVEGRLSDVSLDFIDRASGVGPYALSLLVPSGFLSGSGNRVDDAIARRAADVLAESLADEILRSTDALRGTARVYSFFLDDDVQFRSDDQGTSVSGRVLLRSDSPVRLATCRAQIGTATAIVAFPSRGNMLPGARYEEFPFELHLDGHGPYTRLEISTGGRDSMSRSYTFSVQ